MKTATKEAPIHRPTTTETSSTLGTSSMRIKEQMPVESLGGLRRAFRWEAVAKLLPSIEPGKTLPVEFDQRKDAQALQYWIFSLNNRGNGGQKYRAQRSDSTVFISKV